MKHFNLFALIQHAFGLPHTEQEIANKLGISHALDTLKEHELHQLFGSAFDGNIKNWAQKEVAQLLKTNPNAGLAEITTAVNAALPKLEAAIIVLLPPVLQAYAGLVLPYIQSVVDSLIAHIYVSATGKIETIIGGGATAPVPTVQALPSNPPALNPVAAAIIAGTPDTTVTAPTTDGGQHDAGH